MSIYFYPVIYDHTLDYEMLALTFCLSIKCLELVLEFYF